MQTLEKSLFDTCANLEEIKFPFSLSTIGYGAFCNCTNLTSIELTPNITLLDNRSFSNTGLRTFDTKNVQRTEWGFLYNNSLLEKVYIGTSMESLAWNSFERCPKLKKIIFREGNTKLYIGGQLVRDCTALKQLVLPANTWTIEAQLLRNGSVEKLYIKAVMPPILKGEIQRQVKIYIPIGSLNDYKIATNWSAYAAYFEEYDFDVNPDGVE